MISRSSAQKHPRANSLVGCEERRVCAHRGVDLVAAEYASDTEQMPTHGYESWEWQVVLLHWGQGKAHGFFS